MTDGMTCEFGEYVCCSDLDCLKTATYTYRVTGEGGGSEEGRVYHFCKEHYGDVNDEEDD